MVGFGLKGAEDLGRLRAMFVDPEPIQLCSRAAGAFMRTALESGELRALNQVHLALSQPRNPLRDLLEEPWKDPLVLTALERRISQAAPRLNRRFADQYAMFGEPNADQLALGDQLYAAFFLSSPRLTEPPPDPFSKDLMIAMTSIAAFRCSRQ